MFYHSTLYIKIIYHRTQQQRQRNEKNERKRREKVKKDERKMNKFFFFFLHSCPYRFKMERYCLHVTKIMSFGTSYKCDFLVFGVSNVPNI